MWNIGHHVIGASATSDIRGFFHDKKIWQKICQTKKFLKNRFTNKFPPVGFELSTATITAVKSDV